MDVKILNQLIQEGLLLHLAQSVIDGSISREDAFIKQRLINRSYEISDLPDEEWPLIDVAWNTNPELFYLSMDDYCFESFISTYPDLLVVKAEINEMHSNFLTGSKRVQPPFHENYRSKTSRLIAYLETGASVTPPLILHKHHSIYIAGGNHRFGWAKYRKQGTIPILIRKEDAVKIQQLVPNIKIISS